MRKRLIISLLAFVPFVMGNSPIPYPTTDTYADLALEVSKIGYTQYKLDIANTGDEYASAFIEGGTYLNGNYIKYAYSYYDGFIFETEMIVPGQKKEITLTYQNQSEADNDISENDNVLKCWCFLKEDASIEFFNYQLEYVSEHKYQLNMDVSELGDYYYMAVVEGTYDGSPIAFNCSAKDKAYVHTFINLDLSKLEITNISAYRSVHHSYHSNNYKSVAKIIGLIFFFIVMSMLILGFLALIIVPSSIRKHKKKKAQQNK